MVEIRFIVIYKRVSSAAQSLRLRIL